MSSPLSPNKKGSFRKSLIKIHQTTSHNTRTKILSQHISRILADVSQNHNILKCLDVGCGDMTLAELLEAAIPSSHWLCIDVYELPDELKNKKKWARYRQFDGEIFPFDDNQFDIVLFADVLHHAEGKAESLLNEARRISKFIIIKDHFEFSLWSRFWLWIMDFIGNWGYGIPIPGKYFQYKTFSQTISQANLRIKELITGIDLYQHIPGLSILLRKEWQFIAVLEHPDNANNT